MRSKAATGLVGTGVFALGLAVLFPLVVTPALLKAPAEINLTTHSRSEAQKLDPATDTLVPVTVDLTRKLTTHTNKGKIAGSDSVGVYDELLDLKQVNADGTLPSSTAADGSYQGIVARSSVVAFDRKTGRGVSKYGDTWSTSGQTVKFPFGTKKRTYNFYDQTSGRAWPVSFVRTTKVKGLEVYEFHGTIPEISLGQYGALAGTDTLYSNAGRTILVEPVTGSIVSQTTSPHTSIKLPDGTVTPALVVQELVPTDATVAERVKYSKHVKSEANLLHAAPWVLGVLGLLLLAGGIVLTVRAARRSDVVPERRPDVTGAVPQPRQEPAVDPSRVEQ